MKYFLDKYFKGLNYNIIEEILDECVRSLDGNCIFVLKSWPIWDIPKNILELFSKEYCKSVFFISRECLGEYLTPREALRKILNYQDDAMAVTIPAGVALYHNHDSGFALLKPHDGVRFDDVLKKDIGS
jgi:hypothetical protein